MGTAPDAVKRLVDRFDQDRKVFPSPDYKEEQLRAARLTAGRSAVGVCTFFSASLTEVFKPVINQSRPC